MQNIIHAQTGREVNHPVTEGWAVTRPSSVTGQFLLVTPRCCGSRLFSLLGKPYRCSVLPLIIGQLTQVRSIDADSKELAVRLGGHRKDSFILESHACACKYQRTSIRRPGAMSVARRMGEFVHTSSFWPDEVDAELLITVAIAGEDNPVSPGERFQLTA